MRIKSFPSSPKKLRNYIYKHLTDYKDYVQNRYAYMEKYKAFLHEFSERIQDPAKVDSLRKRVDDCIFAMERNGYEIKLKTKEWDVAFAESDIRIGIEYDDFHKPEIGFRLLGELARWKKLYGEEGKEWKAFTGDEQNVHTKVISDQMNDALRILLSTPVPKHQKTLDEIATAWATELNIHDKLAEVYKDMKHWGSVSEIFQTDDFLYRRTLRGLWANIQTYKGEIRTELIKRLWEECSEAEGLCAAGHMSRLTNVLVGFDEKFKPQISMQEMFQNQMANISAMPISTEEKQALARKCMEEMKIPTEERDVWLDAF
jgi:hypothetical protein